MAKKLLTYREKFLISLEVSRQLAVKVEVQFTPEQATKAQRRSRDIDVLFL
jgi:hypothetical protein